MLPYAVPAVLGAPLAAPMTCPALLLLHILAPRDIGSCHALAALLMPSELPLDLWEEFFPKFNLRFLLPVDDIVALGSPSLVHQQQGHQVSHALNAVELLLHLREAVDQESAVEGEVAEEAVQVETLLGGQIGCVGGPRSGGAAACYRGVVRVGSRGV
jgi:hypothetical protein